MTGRLARLLSLTGLVLLLVAGAAAAQERRVALVVGNGAYRNAPMLANPVKDAEAVAGLFLDAGFDSVELRLDLDSLELKRAVRGFLMTARESDIAVVYFAGHGIEVNGDNFIVPVDAKLKTDFDAEDEGVALDRLVRAVEPARRLRLVILDACRDNPFLRTIVRTSSTRALTAGLGKVEPAVSDTLIAYAARAGSVADEGQTERSPFTAALLAHLPTPGLDIRVAFGRVRDDVLRVTGGRQEPFVYGSLGGSTVSIVPERAPPPPQDTATDARRDYEFAERVGTREAWTSFLQAYPTGFFAELARAQLTKFPLELSPGRPELRKPVAAKPREAAPAPPAAMAAVANPDPGPRTRDACEADRATLARLRADPVATEASRFAKALTCEELRPQLTRLMESIGAAVPPPRGPVADEPAPAPAAAPLTAALPAPASCERESEVLARLRADPDAKAVDRFLREMTCPGLKPQVLRLQESLASD